MPQSSETMIVVHVNDRLGTKAAIPCLASDPISASPRLWLHLQHTDSIKNFSKPKWLPVLVVNPTRSFSNVKANVLSKINSHSRTME
jgi:hypothetical protein